MNQADHSPSVSEPPRRLGHPTGFWFVFAGELAERASYYGMRAILALYMTDALGFDKGSASAVMSYFIAACYLLPLAGGFVADNYLGKYWTIVGFSIPYILGHVVLGIEDRWYLFAALVLLAMGSGVIKPNVSTLMGLTYDQQRPGLTQLRSEAFAIFYFAINIGAAMSSFAMPWIQENWGYRIAFLFPAALMIVAFGVFAAGKRYYATETIGRVKKTAEERHEQRQVLGRLIGLFVVVTFFWSIFDQSASTWVFFANDYLDLTLFGKELNPSQLQAFNPILIVILLPLVTMLWRALRKIGIDLAPTQKMLIGFVLTAATMGVMTIAAYLAGSDGKVSVVWELVAYLLITVAEICISVVGLELSFSAAPTSMKSFVSACWLLTVFFANILNGQITPLYNETLSPAAYFGLLTLMMIPVTLAFIWVARRFNRDAPTGNDAAADGDADVLAEQAELG